METYLEKKYSSLKEKLGFYYGRLASYPLVPPEHVYFSLTNSCNLSCRMCDIPKSQNNRKNELTCQEVNNIILQIREMDIRHLILSGGEPFLRNDILEIAEFAIRNNIEMVDIITNGLLLDDHNVQQLIKINLNHITVSLDGLGKTNDIIRGEGVFEKVKTNLERLNYYKDRHQATLPTLGINFTIMEDNIEEMLPMIEFARQKKCTIVNLQPVLFSNTKMYKRPRQFLRPAHDSIRKLKEVIPEVLRLKDTLDDICIITDKAILESAADYFQGRRLELGSNCYEAIKRMVITCEGKLWSCLGEYGDLRRNDLKNIWFSKAAAKVRQRIRRCKKHCLQDCVYFPADILKQVRIFLEELPGSSKMSEAGFQKDLLETINYYSSVLAAQNIFLNVFKRLKFSKEFKNLYLIRKEVENLFHNNQ